MKTKGRIGQWLMVALLAFTGCYIGQQRAFAIQPIDCCCDSDGCNTCKRSLRCGGTCAGAYPTCCAQACAG